MKASRVLVVCVLILCMSVNYAYAGSGFSGSIGAEDVGLGNDPAYETLISAGISKEKADQLGVMKGVVESLIEGGEVTASEARRIADQYLSTETKMLTPRRDAENSPVPLKTAEQIAKIHGNDQGLTLEEYFAGRPEALARAREQFAAIESVEAAYYPVLRTDAENSPVPLKTAEQIAKIHGNDQGLTLEEYFAGRPETLARAKEQFAGLTAGGANLYYQNEGGARYIVPTRKENPYANRLGFQTATGYATLPTSMTLYDATMYKDNNNPALGVKYATNDIPYMFFGIYPDPVQIPNVGSVKGGADIGVYYNKSLSKWAIFFGGYSQINQDPVTHYWNEDPYMIPFPSEVYVIVATEYYTVENEPSGSGMLKLILYDPNTWICFMNAGFVPPYDSIYAPGAYNTKMRREIALARHVDYPEVQGGSMIGAKWEDAKVGSLPYHGEVGASYTNTVGFGTWNTVRGPIDLEEAGGGIQKGNTPGVSVNVSNNLNYYQESVNIIYPDLTNP